MQAETLPGYPDIDSIILFNLMITEGEIFVEKLDIKLVSIN